MAAHLADGFAERVVADPPAPPAGKRVRPRYVSWSNHLTPTANAVQAEIAAEARRGAPPTPRLTPAWRGRAEDAVWVLVNAPEFVFRP